MIRTYETMSKVNLRLEPTQQRRHQNVLQDLTSFNLWLEPTQQRRHQNVLQDFYTTTTPPKRLAGFNKNNTDDDVNSDHLKAQLKSTKHQGCNFLENHQ
jgi:hypothetical protein